MLLPHDEFVFAELKRNGADHTLRLVFVTHEILVTGQSLRRIDVNATDGVIAPDKVANEPAIVDCGRTAGDSPNCGDGGQGCTETIERRPRLTETVFSYRCKKTRVLRSLRRLV